MEPQRDDVAYEMIVETKPSERESAEASCAVAQGYAFNVHMGADNVTANARNSMTAKGVDLRTASADIYQWGYGEQGQTVTFFSRLTGAGPLSFCVLTVADTSYSEATDLRDAIWNDLKPKLGL